MSVYAEVYSRYVNALRKYKTDITVDPLEFMSSITEGMGELQQETNYIEKTLTLSKESNGEFYLPLDCKIVTQLYDSDGNVIERFSVKQWDKTVSDIYDMQALDSTLFNREKDKFCVFNYHLTVGREAINYDTLTLRYIPIVQQFSIASEQWCATKGNIMTGGSFIPPAVGTYYKVLYGEVATGSAPTTVYRTNELFIGDGNVTVNITPTSIFKEVDLAYSWYPIDLQFDDKFNTVNIPYAISQFERALLDYCLYRYYMDGGVSNAYQPYFYSWQAYIKKAIANKPSFYFKGQLDRDPLFKPYPLGGMITERL